MKDLLKAVIIAQILTKVKHPDADRLNVITISIGNNTNELDASIFNPDSSIQIVTGASNFEIGDFVPFLPPGRIVPGWKVHKNEEVKLESRPLRGIISHGMILAEDEIGIGEDHSGILILNKSPKVDSTLLNETLLGQPITNILSAEVLKAFDTLGNTIDPEVVEQRLKIITRNLDEVIGTEELRKILTQRDPKIYWGTAPTGKPSIGYFLPFLTIRDFLEAGCEVTILLADIHAYLDNLKSDLAKVMHRTEFYKLLFTNLFQVLGADTTKLKFVIGSDYQLEAKYTLDMYKVATQTTILSAKGAGAEVVKQVENPILGGLLYPILQALDEEYLGVDAQLGGIDQRKIFMLAREVLPKIGYKSRIHFMHKLIPGLGKTGKMSSSEPDSKIDFDDTEQIIFSKLNKAYSIDGVIENNSLLSILKNIIFPVLSKKGRAFEVKRDAKWGGDVVYASYEEVERDFVSKALSSVDLKPALARELNSLIAPIREVILANKHILDNAYS